ncbi:LysR family transcriptional regulator [Frateuria aurantia]
MTFTSSHHSRMKSAEVAGILTFVQVVQAGSFTAAGAAMGLTGSAVGKNVSRLEARLATKLLHRTTRQLTLTNDGETFYRGCLRALEELSDVEQQLMMGRAEPVGRVRLDLPGAFGRRHVLPILQALVVRYPRLDLSIMFSERTAAIIDEGIDLAVRIGSLDDDSEMVAKKLGRQRLVICAAPTYLATHGQPSAPEDLMAHDCIIGWRPTARSAWLLRGLDGIVTPHRIRARHALSDGEAMVSATLAGCGLCQLPTWLIADHLASGALVSVLDSYAGAEMPIYAIWPRSRYLPPRIRTIIDALCQAAMNTSSAFHA